MENGAMTKEVTQKHTIYNRKLLWASYVDWIETHRLYLDGFHNCSTDRMKWLFLWCMCYQGDTTWFQMQDILEHIMTIWSHPSFHPFAGIDGAVHKLRVSTGIYVVRLSTTIPGTITISYINHKKNINHIRATLVDTSDITPRFNSFDDMLSNIGKLPNLLQLPVAQPVDYVVGTATEYIRI